MITSYAMRWHTSSFLSEAIRGKHWEEDIRLSDLALQSNSSNYLVGNTAQTIWKLLLCSGESCGPTAQHLQDLI